MFQPFTFLHSSLASHRDLAPIFHPSTHSLLSPKMVCLKSCASGLLAVASLASASAGMHKQPRSALTRRTGVNGTALLSELQSGGASLESLTTEVKTVFTKFTVTKDSKVVDAVQGLFGKVAGASASAQAAAASASASGSSWSSATTASTTSSEKEIVSEVQTILGTVVSKVEDILNAVRELTAEANTALAAGISTSSLSAAVTKILTAVDELIDELLVEAGQLPLLGPIIAQLEKDLKEPLAQIVAAVASGVDADLKLVDNLTGNQPGLSFITEIIKKAGL